MKKKFLGIILACSMVFSISGCTDKNHIGTFEKNPASPEFKIEKNEGLEEFSFNLLRKTYNPGENILISPLSVTYALGMTGNGTGSETRQEFESVLGLEIDELNDFSRNYINKINSLENVKFNLADSIWIDKNINLNSEFENKILENYNAEVCKEKFNDKTVKKINKWVDKNTNGMIPEIINELSPEDIIILINALAFEGEWEEPYEDHQVEYGLFSNYDKTLSDVSFLTSDVNNYVSNGEACGFFREYSGYEYGFFALLPEKDVPVDDFVENLSGAKFDDFFQNISYDYVVHTKIPKFEIEYGENLSGPINNMGLKSAFEPDADFSLMTDEKENGIYISDIIHKTYMKVDENGTKAAAVTAVKTESAMENPEEPEYKEVILNRPFVYGIIDLETMMPVFTGVMNNITAL